MAQNFKPTAYIPAEYTPRSVNFSLFAGPLSKMQEKYDITQSELADTEFATKYLNWANISDPIRAKELVQRYTEERDKISEDLLKNKNFRRASLDLKKLNSKWNKDAERLALEGNFEKYKEIVEEAKKNYKDRPDYMNYVIQKAKEDFIALGGTEFRPSETMDEYNVISGQTLTADLSKDFEDLKLKVANMSPEHARDYLTTVGIEVDTNDKHWKRITEKYKNKEDISNDVENYLRSIERYKPWLKQEAEIDLYFAKQNPEAFTSTTNELLKSYYKRLDDDLLKLNEKSKKDPSILQSDRYNNLLLAKQQVEQAAADPNNPLREALYSLNKINKMYDASALGELLDYKNVSSHDIFRKLADDGLGSGGGANGILAGGFFDPTGYNENLFGLASNVNNSKEAVLGTASQINQLGGGAVGQIIMGSGFKQEQLKGNVEAQTRRIKAFNYLLSEALKSGLTEQQFIERVKNSKTFGQTGEVINEKALSTAYKLAQQKDESGKSAFLSDLNSNIGNLIKQNEEYEITKEHLKNVNDEVESSLEFSNFLDATISDRITVDSDTSELMRKAGFKPKGSKESLDPNNPGVTISVAEYSTADYLKFKGYKNKADAYKKGAFKKDPNLKNNIDQETFNQMVLEEKARLVDAGFGSQMQMYTYAGDQNLDKFLTPHFLNADVIKTYQPIVGTWDNVPGFTEGVANPGTTFKTSSTSPPRIAFVGTKMLIRVPYEYKGTNGQIQEGYVDLDFKSAQVPEQIRILKYLQQNNKAIAERQGEGGDKLVKQTLDMVNTYLYDATTGSDITPGIAENLPLQKAQGSEGVKVQQGGRLVETGFKDTEVDSYVHPGLGVKMSIIKHPLNTNGDYEYRIKLGNSYYKDVNGIYSTTDFNAAKATIAEGLQF